MSLIKEIIMKEILLDYYNIYVDIPAKPPKRDRIVYFVERALNKYDRMLERSRGRDDEQD